MSGAKEIAETKRPLCDCDHHYSILPDRCKRYGVHNTVRRRPMLIVRPTVSFFSSALVIQLLSNIPLALTMENPNSSCQATAATNTNSAATCSPKRVFLIRHAESEENRRLNSLKNVATDLSRFTLPKSSDVGSAAEWFNFVDQLDSDVSENGRRQINDMAELLKKSNFVQNVDMVAHSPLKRAMETSKGLLGCYAPDTKVTPVKRVVDIKLLEEKTPSEWTISYSNFEKRISDMEVWLAEQPEDRVALVGHSQFFKKMLNLDFKFGNCDVWEVEFNPNRTTKDLSDTSQYAAKLPAKWSNLKRLYSVDQQPATESVYQADQGTTQ